MAMGLDKYDYMDKAELSKAEKAKEIKKGVKGPELNIRPNMARGDKASKKSKPTYLTSPSPSAEEWQKMQDADQLGKNRARFKATDEAQAPAFKKGGSVSSASKRADGCCVRGKTRA
jgi:hypothetical protein